jgi:hypothetical protein
MGGIGMSDGTHVGARMPAALVEALDEVAAQGRTSRSEVLREAVRGYVQGDDVDLPDHIEREVRRSELKRRNKLKWQRIHFPSNVADRFRRAFEQGDLDGDLNPGAIEEIREIHVEDARLLFEDDPERRESVIEFVDSVADHARQAEDASEFDALDPEEMFENYAGVEEARDSEEFEESRTADFEEVVADVMDRIDATVTGRQDAALVDAIVNQYAIPESVAQDAVAEARERDAYPGGGA